MMTFAANGDIVPVGKLSVCPVKLSLSVVFTCTLTEE